MSDSDITPLGFIAAIAAATVAVSAVAALLTPFVFAGMYVLGVAWRLAQASPEHAAMLVGLAALVLDYLRTRKLDDAIADRVVDLSARVAVLEAAMHREEREP